MSQSAALAETEISPELVAEHGLNAEEYQKLLDILDREPNLVELGIFSVMWSEHCSYKTTRVHLKNLPTNAPWVICGPGENAGIIDIGDGDAAIFKMESHNHPSFIEPYQGAATGVGGILRDVFTMGARPVALLNALRFGEPEHPKTRHLLSGVVAGVGGYGNCVGVPTVGGECNFHASYNGNNLVNAMAVGIARSDKIFYSAAAGVGKPVIYVGAKTGRDGIHGATMASAEFGEGSEEKRPTVQVGDPFTEKLLIEACLELMATDAILAIQDMGAAGLTCSSLEMADKGGTGIRLDLEKVPAREEGMTPYELMLSESQERMLMVLKPEKVGVAEAIFRKWELDFATIGEITNTGRMELFMHGRPVADLPVSPLSEEAPMYTRPWVPTPMPADIALPDNVSDDVIAPLKAILGSAHGCSRRWIWEQYDSMVMNDTAQASGGDAAIIRVHGSSKALAITSDVTPRYCYANPQEGGKQAVAESWRNLTSVGAQPLAITNCLNFGNPERPKIMGQIVGCLEGMTEACKALDYPVVSGNVSLYNETSGTGILPTPAIGGVGKLENVRDRVGNGFVNEGETVMLIGETSGHVGASLYMQVIHDQESGPPPPVDLDAERRHGDFIRRYIHEKKIRACHDLSDGGLLTALAEMALAGNIGADVTIDSDLPPAALAFGEDQARYLITCAGADRDTLLEAAEHAGVPCRMLGETGGNSLCFNGQEVALAELRSLHEGWMQDYMQQDVV